ncbi:DUF3164 family protein [uncultured Alcanivorax sp.]|jgi:hypothetical protein|uniref:DUF3164 family protein n=1 Tax=uncultured Alcanivorax sp. TaxID=191215 RepID=UPI0025ECE674|nr:DUF3164 family protein [uncultured Alcanivorax sp.]
MDTNAVPEGYMKNAQGHLVPENLVEEVDLVRDDLVRNLVAKGKLLHGDIKKYRSDAMSEVKDFIILAASKYDVTLGGKKGNVSLVSYDGTRMVKVQVASLIRFDERIQAAEQLVNECNEEWTNHPGVPDELKVVAANAFAQNAQGQLSVTKILNLLRWKITHAKWLKAMDIIRDSMQVIGSAEYIRIYERDNPEGQWKAIPLDIAKL